MAAQATVADPHQDGTVVVAVALAAILFPLAYFVADVIEVVQGGFSTTRLVVTYIGEAGIPLFVPALGWLRHDNMGRRRKLGLIGAALYAYSYVFFTSTVVYALAAHTRNWDAVVDTFGPWMTIHGGLMVIGGVAFGAAIITSGAYPRWTGIALIVGVILVAAAADLGNLERTVAAAVSDLAFIGMGLDVLRHRDRTHAADATRGVAATPVVASERSLVETEARGGAPSA